MEALLNWLGHYEPLWLLAVLLWEAVISQKGHSMTKEFYKFLVAQKRVARRRKFDFESLTEGESR